MKHLGNNNGLLNDFTKAIGQQLYFWGCDVESSRGNLLCEYGLERLDSKSKIRSSRYRMQYKGDIIELHGLCVGRYSSKSPSFLYTREFRKCWLYEDSRPPQPGSYNKNLIKTKPTNEVEIACRLFLEWWLEYETWIKTNTDPAYREECYHSYRKLPDAKLWLPPHIGLSWLREYQSSPTTLSRSREWKS